MREQYRHLLAKGSRSPDHPKPRETLGGHIQDVVAVADTLVHSWGPTFLDSMGLPAWFWDDLHRAAVRGALLHDLGKANHHFQRLVRHGPNPPQALRHEWISLFIVLDAPSLDRWLFREGDHLIRMATLFAAVGHHLQLPDGAALTSRPGSGDSRVAVMTGHPDVNALLANFARRFGLPVQVPALEDRVIDLLDIDPLAIARQWVLESQDWWERASPEQRRFLALIKALVIAADLAGSALPRNGIDPTAWAAEVLRRTCHAEELEQLVRHALGGHPPRPFQTKVASAPPRITLIRAGCGSGKTTAAYMWSARHAIGRKLFFCYPTTGTATEGYRQYVLQDGLDIAGALIHSRAQVDLEGESGAPDCEEPEQDRIEALAAWDVPLVVCTADTVLGLVQNARRGLFSFPGLGNGAFVFDEVHSYDDRLFGSLLRFLEAFPGAPALLMTASLPERQWQALREATRRIGDRLADIEGPRDLEDLCRYRLESAQNEDAWTEAAGVLGRGGKVLWVANTVERAVSLGREAERRSLGLVLPYHSRYRYCDRIDKHRDVIHAFRSGGRALAITTQVCEISLDLSADLLVTDLAPVPALIQRLGRLNRWVTPQNPGTPKPALILEPASFSPYEAVELGAARKWLGQLVGRRASQADLARAFLDTAHAGDDIERTRSAWLDGGPLSTPAPVREPGVTIPVIRDEDSSAAKHDRRQVVRLAIPMLLGPVAREIHAWPRLGVALAAPPGRIEYSSKWGAAWRT
jgi:CRISPR-associated endonuclease/helicase Cas3